MKWMVRIPESASRFEDEFYRHYYSWFLHDLPLEPELATCYGIHDYDHMLSQQSVGSNKFWLKAYKARLRFLELVGEYLPPAAFSPTGTVDYEIAVAEQKHCLNLYRWLVDKKFHDKDPVIPLEWSVFATYVPLVTMTRRTQKLVARCILWRVRHIPAVLRSARRTIANPPLIWVEMAEDEVQNARRFFDEFEGKFSALYPRLRNCFREAIRKARRALDVYEVWLAKIKPLANGDFAAGREVLQEIVREWHFLPYSLEELEEIAWQAVGETKAKLGELAKSIDPSKTWRELYLRRIESHGFDESNLMRLYKEAAAQVERFFNRGSVVPKIEEGVDVVPTPCFWRTLIPTAAYWPCGPFEREKWAFFLVSDPAGDRYSDERRKQEQYKDHFGLVPVACHETYPGHHLQMTLAHKHPSIVRRLNAFTIFIEGWGFYVEQLAEEVGLITDPYLKMQNLVDQLWRSYRVIIDIGLHTKKISPEEAQKIYIDELGWSPQRAKREICMYTEIPGYPMCYLLGRREILKWREECLAKGMTLKEFHDLILSFGSIPVSLMKKELALREKAGN